jgi:hypothetical protein
MLHSRDGTAHDVDEGDVTHWRDSALRAPTGRGHPTRDIGRLAAGDAAQDCAVVGEDAPQTPPHLLPAGAPMAGWGCGWSGSDCGWGWDCG